MTKERIIERLLTQGHITMECAGRILTRSAEWQTDIRLLHTDGNINIKESIRLLTEPSIQPACGTASAYGISTCESMGETCRNGKPWDKCTCC